MFFFILQDISDNLIILNILRVKLCTFFHFHLGTFQNGTFFSKTRFLTCVNVVIHFCSVNMIHQSLLVHSYHGNYTILKWNLKKLIIKWCISCSLQSEKSIIFQQKRKKVQNSNISNQIQSLTRPKIFQKCANRPKSLIFEKVRKKEIELHPKKQENTTEIINKIDFI